MLYITPSRLLYFKTGKLHLGCLLPISPTDIYTIIFFIHSLTDGHLGSFHILAIVNNAVKIRVHVSFQVSIFFFFQYMFI